MSTATSVLILGAGQAGLALSWSLSQRGVDHILLERGRVGERWHSERWPGLHLLTPNWMNRLPGPWIDAEPDAFMSAADFAGRLESYREAISAPVVSGCEVQSVERGNGRFRVVAGGRQWFARAVVIATGACDRPAVPAWAEALPKEIAQVVPSAYRGADELSGGGPLAGARAKGWCGASIARSVAKRWSCATTGAICATSGGRSRQIQSSGFTRAQMPPRIFAP
ncbi:NAD(P)-binding domain-containing protein [Mangrovicoccus ximenensis]|uniref:NAD(P)-binding domain-containing protein n=1 Tax=Mangrovicoccus ximenensis TaxID=1911570 RepID=UPI000D35FD4F